MEGKRMNEFFSEALEQSQIKSLIVEKYFGAWSRIMLANPEIKKLGYIDLYSGPGIYEDGTESTPIKILKSCIANPNLHNKIITIFNDADKETSQKLAQCINSLDNIGVLDNKPIVNNLAVDDNITDEFERINMVPCFSFIDPFGYKGLSQRLIKALVKDWGCDCIFFFNFNRINAAITNPKVKALVDGIFGEDVANILRDNVKNISPVDREAMVIEQISSVLSNTGKNFVLPFKFVSAKRAATSHYLIFLSKHALGYEIMKDIMWRSSSEHNEGIGSFSYIPTRNAQLQLLFNLSSPIEELGDNLLKRFAGRTITVQKIYEFHNIGTPFVKANYKEVLRRLEDDNKIIANPPANDRRMQRGVRTMADKVVIKFPR
jgi:three-Cys-motif partner protein